MCKDLLPTLFFNLDINDECSEIMIRYDIPAVFSIDSYEHKVFKWFEVDLGLNSGDWVWLGSWSSPYGVRMPVRFGLLSYGPGPPHVHTCMLV